MKKKSFLAVLCSAALLLQLAPAVLADDVLSDATTDEIVTTEEGVTDFGEFGNALWVLKGDTLTLSGKGDLPDDVHDNYVNTISKHLLFRQNRILSLDEVSFCCKTSGH